MIGYHSYVYSFCNKSINKKAVKFSFYSRVMKFLICFCVKMKVSSKPFHSISKKITKHI